MFSISNNPTRIQWFELERLIELSVITIDLSFVLFRNIRLDPSRQIRNLEPGPIGRLEIESAMHGVLNQSEQSSILDQARHPCAHRAEYSPGAQ